MHAARSHLAPFADVLAFVVIAVFSAVLMVAFGVGGLVALCAARAGRRG